MIHVMRNLCVKKKKQTLSKRQGDIKEYGQMPLYSPVDSGILSRRGQAQRVPISSGSAQI